MGWTGIKASSRRDAMAIHLRDAKVKLGPVWRDDHAWIVAETYPQPGEEAKRVIVCIFVDPSGEHYYFKDVDESMGPVTYDCPETWLLVVPQALGPFAGPWRAEVRSYWSKRRAAPSAQATLGAEEM